MSRERLVLGRDADVAETAAQMAVPVWSAAARTLDRERLVKSAVERVRRRLGNKCARVARAYFNCKPWEKAGLPERTFYHALKKVRMFLGADKHWVKSRSRRTVKRTKWQ